MTQAVRYILAGAALLSALTARPVNGDNSALSYNFSDSTQPLTTVGRGSCSITDGVFRSQGAYALFGTPDMRNYTFSFKARAPKEAGQVQIWAGFRNRNRFDRYMVGIKGGLQDDLYLMRTGYMGTDEFMGVRPLNFHPVPGEWYKLRVEVCGNRIRVFVGDEPLPYIDVTDPNGEALVPTGEVSLGGAWIETEFDDLVITPMADNALDAIADTEYCRRLTPAQKEDMRREQRAAYSPIKADRLNGSRTDISLDGDWLFMPSYECADGQSAASPAADDMHLTFEKGPRYSN